MIPFPTFVEAVDVHAELFARATAETCVCGATKPLGQSFCWNCYRRLCRVDELVAGPAQWLAAEPPTPPARFAVLFSTTIRRALFYDICCDLLRDPNLDTPRKRTRKEEGLS